MTLYGAESHLHVLPRYITTLGDAMWPGTTMLDLELNAAFSEILGYHSELNRPLSMSAICQSLHEFNPTQTSASAGSLLGNQFLKRWQHYLRPLIELRVKDFLDDGSWEVRCARQSAVLADLAALGVLAMHDDRIIMSIKSATRWKDILVDIILRNLSSGTAAAIREHTEAQRVHTLLSANGFEDQLITRLMMVIYPGFVSTHEPPNPVVRKNGFLPHRALERAFGFLGLYRQ